MKLRSALIACLLVATAGAARADDKACASFKWPVAREQAWLAAEHPTLATGAALPKADGAATLQLSPTADVTYAVAPYHKPADGTFGAVLNTTLEKDGIYQVSLAGQGWIDVVQGGKSIKSAGYAGAKGCSIRKSVRFPLKAGPVSVQVSGASVQKLDVTIGAAE
jgi:hypothetical protein